MRLDRYLYEKKIAQSRQKAQELIASGRVWIEGKQILKSSFDVGMEACIELRDGRQWVARSGDKLWGFLQSQQINVEGKCALDIGSSTGGFSEVLLNLGIASVVCVDVGSHQLHPTIRANPRVTIFENQDIRDFVHQPFDLVVCDVSFISLDLILHKVYELTHKECILLFKPQYEVGKMAKRNKRGVIVDQEHIKTRLDEFLNFAHKIGFAIECVQKSVLKGKNGNEEYFIYLSK
ncbi:23S rRNA (cytidine-2'-O)-methyltransferase TlyA [Helicobacter kayseriensis]|uniref:23S rRNA (cytidine-2'-O)-methyltransferase TlyA n=1 Tax=Helicobacter kayseriensis TaxID=2905877 RepID=UPI001E460554|nr:TlyA family RNA methyltransferase [Helicobacter kayseriensis]MCE3047952.1 TlyA family RNA methyltransferase [Helicobacter kayseriensis]